MEQVPPFIKRTLNRPSLFRMVKIALAIALSISLGSGMAYADEKSPLLKNEDLGTEIGQPGKIHLSLNPLIGMWTMDIRVWNGPDDQAPQRLRGTTQRRWILDGRFIEERTTEIPEESVVLHEFRGRRPFMKAGQSYLGVSFLGYDRLAGIFEHIWIHDDSTRMYYSRGRYNNDRSALILRGSWTDPYDGTRIFSRTELTISGDDEHTATRFISDTDTGEFRDLEIVYTRVP